MPGAVGLAAYVEAFYCSRGFLPERLILYCIGRGATPADARGGAAADALMGFARSREGAAGGWTV